jgi:N-methylhydantoinase A
VIPRFPGITSALGCIIADLRHDQVLTVNLALDGLDAESLDKRMVAAGEAVTAVVEAAGIEAERIDLVYELDMHYLGQTHTVSVPLPVRLQNGATGVTECLVRAAFETAYMAAFSRLLPGIPVRIVSLRTAAIGRRPQFDFAVFAPDATASLAHAARGRRRIWFDGGWREATVWQRLALPVGAAIDGPAVLEQPDATTFIEPGLRGTVDRLGNLILERRA